MRHIRFVREDGMPIIEYLPEVREGRPTPPRPRYFNWKPNGRWRTIEADPKQIEAIEILPNPPPW